MGNLGVIEYLIIAGCCGIGFVAVAGAFVVGLVLLTRKDK